MTQFINLQPSAVKIRALAAKGLLISGVMSTHQPRRPHAGRDAWERWGGYFGRRERCACNPPLQGSPQPHPTGLGSPPPPSQHDLPGSTASQSWLLCPPCWGQGGEQRQGQRHGKACMGAWYRGREGMRRGGDVWGKMGSLGQGRGYTGQSGGSRAGQRMCGGL